MSGCAAPAPVKLRIGVSPDYGNELLFLAQRKGFFKHAGVSVELVCFSNLADALRSFEWGLIDGLACTFAETLLAHEGSKRDPDIILLTHSWKRDDFVLAVPSISGPEKIKGKKIALETTSVGVILLGDLLQKLHLQWKEVTVIPTCADSITQLFFRKAIEVAICYPPGAKSYDLDQGLNIHSYHSLNIPFIVHNVIFIDHPFIKKNKACILNFIKAWVQAKELYENEHESCVESIAQRRHIFKETLHEHLEGLQFYSFDEQLKLLETEGLAHKQILKHIEIFKEMGFIDGQTRPKDMIYLEPLLQVCHPEGNQQ